MIFLSSQYSQRYRLVQLWTILLSFAISDNAALQLGDEVHAQTAPPITSSGLNTHISEPINLLDGKAQYNLTGGTRVGENLFHSFCKFNVPASNIANFLNETALPTKNIFGRITADTPSAIFGTLKTTGFGDASLFLMNPSGIVFGPNASLEIGGSVTFTTASALKLAEANGATGVFHTDPMSTSLLTSAPVTAFGFLGSNPAAIVIQGSALSAAQGKAISLIGGGQGFTYTNPDTGTTVSTPGSISVTSGTLTAMSGQINIASVTSPGELSAENITPTPGMTMGNINLSQGTTLDVSGTLGNSAGTVLIRGGKLTVNDSTISANTVNTNGATVAVDIQLTGDLSIMNNSAPAITAVTSGSGNSGKVHIQSANLLTTSTPQDFTLALVDTHTSGTGKAGEVSIQTGHFQVAAGSPIWMIDSGTQGVGNGGDITISAKNVILNQTQISTGDFRARNLPGSQDVTGSGGNITISAESLNMTGATIFSDAFGGHGGNVQLNVGNIQMRQGSAMGVSGLQGSGAFTLNAHSLLMDGTQPIEADTAFSAGRPLTITADIIELRNGSSIRSHTVGNSDAGDIVVTARDRLIISDTQVSGRPSGFYSSSVGIEDAPLNSLGGHSGSVSLVTPRLEMAGGGRIDTSTQTSGRGGDVVITAGSISIAGERTLPVPEDDFDIAGSRSSGIFSRSNGSEFCSGPCGEGGLISITTASLTLANGAVIDSTSNSTGPGGDITIRPTDTTSRIDLSGTLTDGSPVGIFSRSIGMSSDAGSGGNISLTAGRSITIQAGASISSSSTGPGIAGNILINAGKQLDVLGTSGIRSSITTKSDESSGGNINLEATDHIRFVNSDLSASVSDGPGGGGNISIDPKLVLLQNSTVLAQADQGTGGRIAIRADSFLADANSVVNADAGRGINGTVTIQSPTSNLSGTVGQLASKTNPPQVLLHNRCIALAGGEQSTFILSGRDTVPAEPGGWLKSPMSMERWTGEVPEEHVSRLMVRNRGWNTQPPLVMAKDETTALSLRRLTPPGFLVRSFATGTTGCPS